MKAFELRINDALHAKETVVFSAHCSIAYSGRAESFLGYGDRLILIKQDGTLLVHKPSGSTPINYMKEGAVHTLKKGEDGMVLQSRSSDQKEFLEIMMKKIHFINSLAMLDHEQIMLQGSEKDMSDMIFDNPSLISPGFRPLSREEHTKFGFIDVFGYDVDGKLTVVECKRDRADFSAVSQLERYVGRIKAAKGLSEVKGILAAPSISNNAGQMLKEKGFSFKAIAPPKFLERHSQGQARLGDY